MPFKPQTKKTGDLVQSQDWNDAIEELLRLEKDKVNRSGNDNKITGPLTIEGALSAKEVTFSGALTVNNISVVKNVTISSDLATLGNVSIGIPTAENANHWDRVLDIKGTGHTKLSIRTQFLNIDGRVLVHHKGFWEAPAGMMVGTHSNHPLSFATNSLTRLTILNSGNVGIGTTEPKAKLDIALVPRSGTHPTTVKGLYVTGDFKDDSDGVEFRHTNGTQGIGFGSNTIYAAGSNANQDLGLQAKGTGEVKVTGKLSVSGNLTVTGKVNERNISADGLKLDAHTHNGTDSQKVKHSDLTLDGGTNPHKTTAADVGALSTSGGTVTGSLSFGSSMRQMLNLWDTGYAIGVQSHTQYFRTSYNFAWYKGGLHNDNTFNAGGGTSLMTLDSSGNLSVLGTISPAGSETNKDLGLKAKGTGKVKIDSSAIITGNLDISSAARTGTHPTAVKGLYITGDCKADSDGVEFRHSNGTQGIGFGYNTIYAAGSNDDQDLGLKAKGTGEVKVTGKLSVTGSLSFGSQTRQMLNLWGTGHGIGVQNNTTYFRTSDNFAWYKGGSHNDAAFNAGTNGTSLMTLDGSGNLSVLGNISPAGSESNKDLGLKAKGTGKVKIDSSAIITGKVGIGTKDTDTTHRLTITSTDKKTLRLIGQGQHGTEARLNFGDHDEIYITEDQDKKLLIHADTRITLDSHNVGIGTTDPKAKLDVNGSVKFGENGTIINQMICGQVFYNTSTSKWQYSTSAKKVKVLKIDRAEFRIYYGFTVKSAQELMILATTFEKRADHTACVRQIHQDNCVICIINTKTQDQKEQNFSFMIVHCQAPPDTARFLDVDNEKEKEYRTEAPVDTYYYTL